MNEAALTPNAIVAVTKEQVATKLDDDIVILGFKTGNYYGLNAVGALIWEKIQQPISVQEIVKAITAEYSVSEDEALSDATALLNQLIAEGLVRVEA